MNSSEDEDYTPNYLTLSSPFLDDEDVDKENVPSGSSIGTPSTSHANVSSNRINKNTSCKRRTSTQCFPSTSFDLQPATIPASSTSSTGALKRVLEENTVSLAKLGRVVRQFDITVEDEEMLTSKISDIKINMQHVKNIQTSVETLPSSSDSVVRALTSVVREQMSTIAGLSLTVNALLSKMREQNKELKRTSFHIAKNRERSLPQGYGLKRSNISRVWHLDSAPPFKELNMVEVLEKWQRPQRAHKHDHFLLVLDFLRHFFIKACEPPTEIQQYACRQSGKKGKFDHLKDLPEGLVDFLISFILDALGLYRDQLLRTPDEHKRNPNKWWLDLAEDDDARERLFHVLSEERVLWSAHARTAIGRALEDIRRYHFDPERSMLLPSKKKRVMVEGTSINKEVMIQKTENVEDEVEVFEEA